MSKSNQHEEIPMPQGRVHYSEGQFGMTSAAYMSAFCSAADLVIHRLKNATQEGAQRAKTLETEAKYEADLIEDFCAHTLSVMLNTVTVLGIEPLVVWLSGRLEQEDI